MKVLQEFRADLNSIHEYVPVIANTLKSSGRFIAGFQGELGAGKTYLIGQILYAFGLSDEVPVSSPTYAVTNDYQIGEKIYLHADFYKANWQNTALEDFLEDYDFHGALIEWPDLRVGQVMTHKIEIEDYRDHRRYVFSEL